MKWQLRTLGCFVGVLAVFTLVSTTSVAQSEPPPDGQETSACLSEGTGTALGDVIGDFTLTNCLGEQITLHAHCAVTKAIWLMFVTAWCPSCSQTVPFAAQKQIKHAEDGLELMVLLGEDDWGMPPTLQYCWQYARSHEVNAQFVYIMKWTRLNELVNTCAAKYVPWNAVLRGADMRYLYSDECDTGEVDLEATLAELIPGLSFSAE